MQNFELSNSQKFVIKELVKWINFPSDFITVGGFAGTGKTSTIAYFRSFLATKIKRKVAFCSYTGKAVRVLESKLKEFSSLQKQDSVSTIHSLLYAPVTNSSGEVIVWSKKSELNYDLIIVDEASMVDEYLWQDLLSFKIPIIAVGDHGQLPPIQGSFNLMKSPKLKLEEIHRQAEGNPIIALSMLAREKKEIEARAYSPKVKKFDKTLDTTFEEVSDLLSGNLNDTLVLCGFNHTRVKLNQTLRANREIYEQAPIVGDKVICLKNNHEKLISNGMLGKIEKIEYTDEYYDANIKMDNGVVFSGTLDIGSFNNKDSSSQTKMKGVDYFDFGYALTVHKAQGSQAKRVILFEERSSHMDDDTWFRWLYTGITRAQEELYIIG